MCDSHYVPFYGRLLIDDKTWRIMSVNETSNKCVVRLENEYYIVEQKSEEKEVTLDEFDKLPSRKIQKLAKYMCKSWAENPAAAINEWNSGNGWRSPEGVWIALRELCRKFITDEEKCEHARRYYNDEYCACFL